MTRVGLHVPEELQQIKTVGHLWGGGHWLRWGRKDPGFPPLGILIFLLAVPRGLQNLSSPTRDRTHALGSESAECQPLDHQGIPRAL